MLKNRIVWLATRSAFVVSTHAAGAQRGAATGLYQIISGTYAECCGFGGGFHSALPNENLDAAHHAQAQMAHLTLQSEPGEFIGLGQSYDVIEL